MWPMPCTSGSIFCLSVGDNWTAAMLYTSVSNLQDSDSNGQVVSALQTSGLLWEIKHELITLLTHCEHILHTQTHIYTHTHRHTHTYTQLSSLTVNIYYTRRHTYIHIYTETHTYTHRHAQRETHTATEGNRHDKLQLSMQADTMPIHITV